MRCQALSPRLASTFLLPLLLLTNSPVTANPHPAISQLAGFSFNDLFRRWDCAGAYCGYNSQLCCTAGAQCFTDANNQAQCGAATATAAAAPAGGYWQYYTTTIIMTGTTTVTKVMSSYIGGAQPTPASGKACNYALNESPCGEICCASNQYCFKDGQCNPIGNGPSSTSYYGVPGQTVTVTGAGAPIRPTSSGQMTRTVDQTLTSTIPFMSPFQTGSNVTLTEAQSQGGGLSGGAIAGIVIGVLLGLALLGLLCFCCIVRGLWGIIFGGKKKKRRTEVEEYERRSHHASGGRTWYGAAKPARTSRYEEKKSEHHTGRNLLGVGAGLATLWAVLGLKRKRDEKRRRDDDRYTEYSYSSYDYTSSSSASSDDRRTRDTRRSQSRR